MRRSALVLSVALAACSASGCQVFTTAQSAFDPGVRNQGWWADGPANYTQNDAYTMGFSSHVTTRDFFTFDLSSACQATAVSLQLSRLGGFASERFADSIPLDLFDVNTPAATLNNNSGANLEIWNDLGSGVSFGHFDITPGQPSDVITLPLNSAGVAAFNAARGGFFSIGGTGPTPGFPDSYTLFDGDAHEGIQQLLVICPAEAAARD
jgi:hypothetical protein